MLKRVQLKTKQELLKMGYEYNDNPEVLYLNSS